MKLFLPYFAAAALAALLCAVDAKRMGEKEAWRGGEEVAAVSDRDRRLRLRQELARPITYLGDPRLNNPWTPAAAAAALPNFIPNEPNSGDREGNGPANSDRSLQASNDGSYEGDGETRSTEPTYEVIIVGAGPGGIAAAHTLVKRGVNASRILIIERGPALEDYVAKGYDDALLNAAATADPDFREDVEGTPIVVGRGIGGGTLHFGMQFIDQDQVADASARQPVEGSDLREDVSEFACFAQATGYRVEDYAAMGEIVNNTHAALIGKMDEIMGHHYSNKVYKTAHGDDLSDQRRLLLGELIPTGVVVQSETEVQSLIAGDINGVALSSEANSTEFVYGKHVILAAGALNSARLALKSGVATATGEYEGRKFLEPLWDHHGMVVTYFPPGTEFSMMQPAPLDETTLHGLPVYSSIEEAREANTNAGFIAHLSIPILDATQVGQLTAEAPAWSAPDPTGDGTYSYLFDLGDFFTASRHPGGNRESLIVENDYDLGVVLSALAPETHKTNKISRIVRSGGRIIGVLDSRAATPFFNATSSNVTADIGGEAIIGHLQTRPENHTWQYYFVTAGASNLIIGVSTTGELIADDGRVYEGDAIGPETIHLPSLTQRGYEAIIDGLNTNDEILSALGWTGFFWQRQSFPATIEDMRESSSFLASTYHYHGTLSQTTLSPGFYAGDLSRMRRKWAGSTSVAAGAMGVQAGNEVADALEV